MRELEKSILPEVKKVSKEAGKKLLSYSKKLEKLKVSSKKAEGMVSEADVKTEQFIQRSLRKVLKKADFLGEESLFLEAEDKKKSLKLFQENEWTWIVDPLDGTHNFLSGLDYYAVCIALAYYGEPILGVVYRPSDESLYFALKGKGAFKESPKASRKKKLIIKKENSTLKNCMLVTGFSLEKGIEDKAEIKAFEEVAKKSRGVRRFGSAALDMCHVAEGKFDGFWEKGLSPWDVAASGLICQEAGLKLTDYNGKLFHPFQNSILCSTNKIHNKIRRLILSKNS